MCRIILPLMVGALACACGVSQSRYDTLHTRAEKLEQRAQQAEAKLAHVRPCPRPRKAHRGLQRKLRRCRRALRATRHPLVLASHTLEQEFAGGRRRASTVTLLPGTVLLPLSARRARRARQARRAERSLRRSLSKQLSRVAACYHRVAKKRRRPPEGQLSFAFEITRRGRIRRVTVVHRLLRSPVTVRCAQRVLRRLHFPRQRRALWAVFPMEFHTGRPYASAAPEPARR